MAGEGVGRWADVSAYEGDTVAIDRWQVRRHSGTSVTETVYRHEIRPALTTGATAMNKILSKKRPKSAQAVLDKHTLRLTGSRTLEPESAGHCERQHGGLVNAGSPGHPAAITQGG